MEIVVNGESRRVDDGLAVSSLLDQLGVSLDYIVVERNRTIVPRDAFETTRLSPEDRVEVISFIGGGCGQMSHVRA